MVDNSPRKLVRYHLDRAIGEANILILAVLTDPTLPDGVRRAIVEADYLLNTAQDSLTS